jgi:hypothetical protein
MESVVGLKCMGNCSQWNACAALDHYRQNVVATNKDVVFSFFFLSTNFTFFHGEEEKKKQWMEVI